MTTKVIFDALNYAKMLKQGGIEYADVHSACLAEIITHNIYTKNEVDTIIEAALQELRQQTLEMKQELRATRQEFRLSLLIAVKELENRMDKMFNRALLTNISVLGTLIIIVGAISSFAHHFV